MNGPAEERHVNVSSGLRLAEPGHWVWAWRIRGCNAPELAAWGLCLHMRCHEVRVWANPSLERNKIAIDLKYPLNSLWDTMKMQYVAADTPEKKKIYVQYHITCLVQYHIIMWWISFYDIISITLTWYILICFNVIKCTFFFMPQVVMSGDKLLHCTVIIYSSVLKQIQPFRSLAEHNVGPVCVSSFCVL